MYTKGREFDDFISALYLKHRSLMYRIARAYTKCYADAEDIVSDSMISIIQKKELLYSLPEDKQRAYIKIVVNNKGKTAWKKMKRRKHIIYDCESECFWNFIDYEVQNGNVNHDYLTFNWMKGMPQIYIDIIRLKYINEMSDNEIATMVNIKPNTVRVRVFRARQKIKKRLELEGMA